MKKKYQVGGISNIPNTREREVGNGIYNYNPYFQGFNVLAQGVTGIANEINDNSNRKRERDLMTLALQSPIYGSNNYGSNDNLIYAQYGGGGEGIEVEKGEIINDGENVMKVNDRAPTHENGGVVINDNHSVLENTSSIRNDIKSKELKLSPNEIGMMFDIKKPNRALSHSKAFEYINEKLDRERAKYIKKNENIGKGLEPDKISLDTFDLNNNNSNVIPKEQEIFNKLLMHQEQIKSLVGIKENETNLRGQYGVSKTDSTYVHKDNYDIPIDVVKKELSKKIPSDNGVYYINDNRTIRKSSGNKIDDTERKTGEYKNEVINNIILNSIKNNVDPKLALSIGLTESGLGKYSSNVGQVLGNKGNNNKHFTEVLSDKINVSKKRGIKNPELIIQSYNGLGKLFPDTEGNPTGKFYGVDIPDNGLSMKEHPLYGREVIDNKQFFDNEDINKRINQLKSLSKLSSFKQYGGIEENRLSKYLNLI
jgi:hypothetical protein